MAMTFDTANAQETAQIAPRYILISGHPASDHQADIFDVMPDRRSGSYVIVAVASAGKTAVIKNALRYLPSGTHVQEFALNVPDAKSLKDALAKVISVDRPEGYRNMIMGTGASLLERNKEMSDEVQTVTITLPIDKMRSLQRGIKLLKKRMQRQISHRNFKPIEGAKHLAEMRLNHIIVSEKIIDDAIGIDTDQKE
jgi:hypothetical protein